MKTTNVLTPIAFVIGVITYDSSYTQFATGFMVAALIAFAREWINEVDSEED